MGSSCKQDKPGVLCISSYFKLHLYIVGELKQDFLGTELKEALARLICEWELSIVSIWQWLTSVQ